MDELGHSVSVGYPELRERLKKAVAAIADEGVHERLWRRGQRVSPEELGFDDSLLVIVDELDVIPSDNLVGDVLVDVREARALRSLQVAIWALTDQIGTHGQYVDAVATGDGWLQCRRAASDLMTLLDRDGCGLDDRSADT